MSVGVIADEPSARISAHPSGRQSRHRKPSDSAALAMEIMKASVGMIMQLLAMLDRLHELHSKSMISAGEMELLSSWARKSIFTLLSEQLSLSST